jgi:hypothetical protein
MPPQRVLVSNDDGINAPGLRALVGALSKLEDVEVYVCAPSEERSGQSHAITLTRFLSCHPHPEVQGAVEAYAVDGGLGVGGRPQRLGRCGAVLPFVGVRTSRRDGADKAAPRTPRDPALLPSQPQAPRPTR